MLERDLPRSRLQGGGRTVATKASASSKARTNISATTRWISGLVGTPPSSTSTTVTPNTFNVSRMSTSWVGSTRG